MPGGAGMRQSRHEQRRPATPPARIAPSNQGISRRGMAGPGRAVSPDFLSAAEPAERPLNEAASQIKQSRQQDWARSHRQGLAKGVLAPNSSAAAKAGVAERMDIGQLQWDGTPIVARLRKPQM
ncbi:hypothetical protein GCM10023063_49880 [Arthrobacter methylotrophus]